MKRILLLFIFFSCFISQTFSYDLTVIRKLFYKASFDENSLRQLEELLEDAGEGSDPIIRGYKAMAYMFISRNSFFPYTKLNNFLKGKYFLESAIKMDSLNVELRYMRFIVQTHVPFFLNYSKDIENDKKIILNNINKLTEPELKQYITSSIIRNSHMTFDDKNKLADIIADFKNDEGKLR